MLASNELKNILTLRYNPESVSSLRKLSWKDFQTKSSHDEASTIEILIKKSILKFVEKNNITKTTLALSGGIDSMLILSLFRETCPDINITCISAGFDENDDELKQAEILAKKHDCDFQPIILDNFLNNLPLQISIIQEPKWHYYWFFLADKATKFSNSLLSGDGGDELFGGYVFRYQNFLTNIDLDDSWKEKTISYLNCHNRDWVDDQTSMFGPNLKFSWEKIYDYFKPFF